MERHKRVWPRDFEERSGFIAMREGVAALALGAGGRRAIESLRFEVDPHRVALEMARLGEMKGMLLLEGGFPSEEYHDLSACLPTLKRHDGVLSITELHTLRLGLSTASDIRDFIAARGERVPHLLELANTTDNPSSLCVAILSVLTETGTMRDDASPELRQIRSQLAKRAAEVSRRLNSLLSKGQQGGWIDPQAQVVLRDGNALLPVVAGKRKAIGGVAMDRSASGQTLFIAPYEVLELQQSMRDLEAQEQEEIHRILRDLSDSLRVDVPIIAGCGTLLVRFDSLRARALWAIQHGGAMPIESEDERLVLRGATHPELRLRLESKGEEPIPLNLTLDDKSRVVVVSGPNAGGKSLCLKTLACIVYAHQCGFLPMALDNSELPIVSHLLLDIGDSQSVENDLSTYSSHLAAMRAFLHAADAQSLFLIDEMGSGTDPLAGGAIAQAVLEGLANKGSKGVVTTHYSNLKQLGGLYPGVVNAAMRFDERELKPLYVLEVGFSGSSYAFEMARRMGLPADTIERASAIAGEGYIRLEEQLRRSSKLRRKLAEREARTRQSAKAVETLKQELETARASMKEERKSLLQAARTEAKQTLEQANRLVERTIREIRESSAERQVTRTARARLEESRASLEEKLAQDAPSPTASQPAQQGESPLGEGDTVRIVGTQSVGRIMSVRGSQAVVAIGQMMSSLALDRLERANEKELRKASMGTPRSASMLEGIRQRHLNFHPELDVRGQYGEAAVAATQALIDDAMMVGASQVRVLHGKGNGILRSLIRELAASHPSVRKFNDDDPDRGGAGITVIWLK